MVDVKIERLKRQLARALEDHLRSPKQPIELPEAGRLIWTWFNDLSQARSWHANGPNPIAYVDIAAYAVLMDWPLRPYETSLIRFLDETYVNAFYESRRTDASGVKKLPQRSEQAVSPELFDLTFRSGTQ